MSDEVYVCDRCGDPIKDGDLIYTLASRPAEGIGRHAKCHDLYIENLRANAREHLARAKELIRGLSRRGS